MENFLEVIKFSMQGDPLEKNLGDSNQLLYNKKR